jgi:hypothetical protein
MEVGEDGESEVIDSPSILPTLHRGTFSEVLASSAKVIE